ncbi:tRNA (adenine(22)-N(1))-methyltransferase [Paenibacillus lemnae]|uniref:tRNA (Adenine-N(1))-methyltransferase n=1 Tax=Paenibacillus lemnae TaxID=1330551 RepID=A0A848M2P2_PAELE|nr:class I SAM-dependent methyltransferase [Paenibacillus lemnae]NMO94816.1 tRNA (adenine-N(1))-methyltransferase [Paenibacillus lemnae]
MKLSNRLQSLLNHIPAGSRLADIGSDHALLPTAAVQTGVCVSAVAGEVNSGPHRAAEKQVQEAGLAAVISVRKGDGLDVIHPGEVDVITIAGMGGGLISSILDRGHTQGKLQGIHRLILQPNVGEDLLRKWLVKHHWVLIEEDILEEDGKIYEVLTAVPEEEEVNGLTNEELYQTYRLNSGLEVPQAWLLRFGPWLIRKPVFVFHAKWRSELGKMAKILASLAKSELSSASEKAGELKQEMDTIKEVLSCLQKDKP